MERIVLESDGEAPEPNLARKRKRHSSDDGKRSTEVEIGGRPYRIRGDIDEDWLKRVAAAVDDAMKTIQQHTDTVDSLEVAVLTALNLSRELLYLRDRVAELEKRPGRGGTADLGDLRDLIELVESELEEGSAAPSGEPGAT